MDSPAASRGKIRFPPVSFLFPFAEQRPVSFFLHPVCLPESTTVSSLTGSLDAAQMRPQLPLFRRSLSELAAPSKSYHTLSGISINAAALIARSSPYYRRAALRPRSYAALAEFIATPSSAIRRPSERVLEEEARTSGKPKSAIPITRTIYRSPDVLVSIFRLVSELVSTRRSLYICSYESLFFLRIAPTVEKFLERILYANVDLPTLAARSL